VAELARGASGASAHLEVVACAVAFETAAPTAASKAAAASKSAAAASKSAASAAGREAHSGAAAAAHLCQLRELRRDGLPGALDQLNERLNIHRNRRHAHTPCVGDDDGAAAAVGRTRAWRASFDSMKVHAMPVAPARPVRPMRWT
jgi:hypothetical protein